MYKRQGVCSAVVGCDFLAKAAVQHAVLQGDYGFMGLAQLGQRFRVQPGDIAVSYTHLDVYKRQWLTTGANASKTSVAAWINSG